MCRTINIQPTRWQQSRTQNESWMDGVMRITSECPYKSNKDVHTCHLMKSLVDHLFSKSSPMTITLNSPTHMDLKEGCRQTWVSSFHGAENGLVAQWAGGISSLSVSIILSDPKPWWTQPHSNFRVLRTWKPNAHDCVTWLRHGVFLLLLVTANCHLLSWPSKYNHSWPWTPQSQNQTHATGWTTFCRQSRSAIRAEPKKCTHDK
jgi:hypothetical protein